MPLIHAPSYLISACHNASRMCISKVTTFLCQICCFRSSRSRQSSECAQCSLLSYRQQMIHLGPLCHIALACVRDALCPGAQVVCVTLVGRAGPCVLSVLAEPREAQAPRHHALRLLGLCICQQPMEAGRSPSVPASIAIAKQQFRLRLFFIPRLSDFWSLIRKTDIGVLEQVLGCYTSGAGAQSI